MVRGILTIDNSVFKHQRKKMKGKVVANKANNKKTSAKSCTGSCTSKNKMGMPNRMNKTSMTGTVVKSSKK